MKRPEAGRSSVTRPNTLQERKGSENTNILIKRVEPRARTVAPVYLMKSEASVNDRAALAATGGIIVKANGKPTVKDYIDSLKNLCPSYASWKWNPIPIAQGILFKFPTDSGLELLTKREVIPCRNGQFFIKRWKEGEGKDHAFQVRASVLAYNVPPYLRSEEEMAKVVAPFVHLIDAVQIMEEGGPVKLTVGCRRRSDIPKEIPVVFGGKEFKIALAIRDIIEERGGREEQMGALGNDQKGGNEEGKEKMEALQRSSGKKREGGSKSAKMDGVDEIEACRMIGGQGVVSSVNSSCGIPKSRKMDGGTGVNGDDDGEDGELSLLGHTTKHGGKEGVGLPNSREMTEGEIL